MQRDINVRLIQIESERAIRKRILKDIADDFFGSNGDFDSDDDETRENCKEEAEEIYGSDPLEELMQDSRASFLGECSEPMRAIIGMCEKTNAYRNHFLFPDIMKTCKYFDLE
jgi:hypothetical protein